jgi:hypothetical protein
MSFACRDKDSIMRLIVILLASLLLGWGLPATAVCVSPAQSLNLWLKYSVGKTLGANQQQLLAHVSTFTRAAYPPNQNFHWTFNPGEFLDDVHGIAGLKVFAEDGTKLVNPNKALLPGGLPEDIAIGLDDVFLYPLVFIEALLDRLLEVMDPQLVEAARNCIPAITTGLAFFSTKFGWSLGNTQMDPNVCMPFNLTKVKAARYMSYRKSKGYLAVTLGDGESPKSPCIEYAHRLMCFFFHGPPPAGKECVSHRCHNKECLNPSHLVWASPWDNYHQAKREHNHDP